MATLIGAGSHADDIWRTFGVRAQREWRRVAHHSDFVGDAAVMIGVNNPQLRATIAEAIDMRDYKWVHPQAWMSSTSSCDYGTHINYGVTMTRTTIGRHCTISPGVTICGDVTIGDRVLIGAGATICDRVIIGDDVTIGAGAVVLPETTVPNGTTWVGVPARQVKP